MNQFRAYRLRSGRLVVSLQSDYLQTATRIVAPLIPLSSGDRPFDRLEPVFELDGESYFLALSEIAAIPARNVPTEIAYDLRSEQDLMKSAVNLLFWGF